MNLNAIVTGLTLFGVAWSMSHLFGDDTTVSFAKDVRPVLKAFILANLLDKGCGHFPQETEQ